MSEVLLPTWIIPEKESHEWLDEGSVVFPAAFAPGIAQRQSYGGLRLKLSRQHTVRAEEKAQLLSILKATRGRFNALRTKVHFALRGTGFGGELVTNGTFANGTTGWTAGADATLSAADRMMRVERSAVTGATHYAYQDVTVSANVPYVGRVARIVGRGSPSAGVFLSSGNTGQSLGTSSGLFVASAAPTASPLRIYADNSAASGVLAGDYYNLSYASVSRCALVDNGTNLLQRSDEFDNAYWTKTAVTVSANAVTSPEGTAIADGIFETTATSAHTVNSSNATISSAVADYSFSCALGFQVGRQWAYLQIVESTGGHACTAYFNVQTGVVGTTSSGANWNNLRSFITPMGNGWFYCTIVARKLSAATALSAYVGIASANGTASYTGVAVNEIAAFRGTLAQSSFPTRLIQTTSAASTGTAQTGNGLYLKGLTVSSSGLLLPEDFFEINGELKQANAGLNADAAGLAFLQFEPGLIRSPADGDPVITTDSMGKFLMSNLKIDNEFGTQAVVTYDLEHIYE